MEALFAKLIGDKAYGSDTLDEKLHRLYGIEMIAPHNHSFVNYTLCIHQWFVKKSALSI